MQVVHVGEQSSGVHRVIQPNIRPGAGSIRSPSFRLIGRSGDPQVLTRALSGALVVI